MIIHTMEQRSIAWHNVRAGKLTGSNAQAIGAGGKGLETLVYATLAEKYSNNQDEPYTSADMQRGIELEAQARETYEIMYDTVQEVGFIEHDEYSGVSPDGLIGEDGGFECKCPNDANFFKILVNGEKAIESKYIWQVQMCLLVSQRKWWDLVFYSTNFNKNMIVFRIYPDMEKQEKLLIGLDKGKKLIKEIDQKYGK